MNTNIKSIEDLFHENLQPIVPGLETSSSYFSNIGWTTWLLIILILAFLGINIFVYLAKGTEQVNNILAPILSLFGGTVAKTVNVSAQGTQELVNASAQGTQELVNASAGTVTVGLNQIQNITGGTPETAVQQPDITINNSLNRSLNTSTEQKQQENGEDYVADDSTSPIQQGKMGWCFIGEDRGFRSCAYVGANDQCMSGDIFPSKDVCMNPNLRA